MSIASQITRLQGVKGDILQAISDKGVTVPAGSDLAACPALIAAISGGGAITLSLANIMPTTGVKVVDDSGYIGGDFFNPYYPGTNYYNNFAIKASGADFSSAGLGQVTFVDTSATIGGRVYPTVTIGGVTWMAENLDYKFSGVEIGGTSSSSWDPKANYYNRDEATYGINGNKYGLLYNWTAVNLLETNKAELIPGWHVPTGGEFQALFTSIGGYGNAGLKLKSTTGWNDGGNGDGSYSFNIVPAGSGTSGFSGVGYYCNLWTSDLHSSSDGETYGFRYDSDGASWGGAGRNQCYSVRLVKDSA